MYCHQRENHGNKKDIENKLKLLNAKKIIDDDVNALYFDYKDNSLRKNGKILRLRTIGNKAFLTLKHSILKRDEHVKVREEYEIKVSSFNVTKKILELLGLSVWLNIKKHRTSYVLNGVHFEIDKYEGQYDYIPTFLEIEAGSSAVVYKYAQLLGFDKKDCKPWTLRDLIEYYKPGGKS